MSTAVFMTNWLAPVLLPYNLMAYDYQRNFTQED